MNEAGIGGWILAAEIITMSGVLVGLYWIRELYLSARAVQEDLLRHRNASVRPWLNVTMQADGNIDVLDDGVGVMVKVIYQNMGSSPAIRAHTMLDAAALNEQSAVMARLCAEARDGGSGSGILLGPGETFIREWYWHYRDSEWPGEVRRLSGKLAVGCVSYETPYDKQVHQTAFVFLVDQTEEGVKFHPWAGGFAT